jgi:deoxyribodipyrimidine photo-lyase
VPELVNCSDKEIHAPWLIPPLRQQSIGVIIGKTYPAPIVEHATQRALALDLYKTCTLNKVLFSENQFEA